VAIAEILMGNPKLLGASLIQGHAYFLLCDFMMGLRKPQQHAKFELASFSHCINIEGEPSNFWGESLAQSHVHFPLGVILRWPWQTVVACPNIEGNPKIFGSSPSPGPRQLFLLVGFDDGPW